MVRLTAARAEARGMGGLEGLPSFCETVEMQEEIRIQLQVPVEGPRPPQHRSREGSSVTALGSNSRLLVTQTSPLDSPELDTVSPVSFSLL